MAMDADNVYVRTRAGVESIDKETGSMTMLASVGSGLLDDPIVFDDLYVYALDEGEGYCDLPDGRVPALDKNTGESTVVADGLFCPAAVASDGRHVYFIARGKDDPDLDGAVNATLQRAPRTGGVPEVLARTPMGSAGLVLTDAYAYFTIANALDTGTGSVDSVTLARVSKNGGRIERISGDCELIVDMRQDGDGVLYGDGYGYVRADDDGSLSKLTLDEVNTFSGTFAVNGKDIFQLNAVETALWKVERN